MKERPILMSAPMVRAILAGAKTQTRRVMKGTQPWGMKDGRPEWAIAGSEPRCPYGVLGDRLWVRETWAQNENQLSETRMDRSYAYAADNAGRALDNGGEKPWRPSIHMPRWASRITLEVTGVRVERLQDISEADAIAEGISFSAAFGGYHTEDGRHFHCTDPIESYASLWDSIHGAGSWDANPFVWCVSFKRIDTSTQREAA